jgi:L-asparaginase
MPKKSLPKILILYTGGTFGMSPGLNFKALSPVTLKKRLLQQVPEIQALARCEVLPLFQLDSCQMGPPHWLSIAEIIRSSANGYQGVVVLHGTDTLAYTAAALSILLSPAPLPVVLTGAQKPLAALRNDARGNLVSAIEVAASAPRSLRNRVMVAFHDELYLGSRVRKKSAQDFDAFESPRFPILATIGNQIQYHDVIHHLPKLTRKKNRMPSMTARMFAPQILKTEVTPLTPKSWSSDGFLKEIDAILITLYPSGTAPTDDPNFSAWLQAVRRRRIPIFGITERNHSLPKLGLYPSGKILQQSGVHWCESLTPEAAWVKIWYLLAQQIPISKATWNRRLADEN